MKTKRGGNDASVTAKMVCLVSTILLTASALLSSSLSAQASCNLQSSDNKIMHVAHIPFDNVHLLRDNPNVPSDLEQIPNLLNFDTQNGHHTPLISHTATDILTMLTGVYGDRHGEPVANSYGFFRPNGLGRNQQSVPLLDLALERFRHGRRRVK
jgi:hypothetical protein